MILLIDNYDSFSYNLYQLIGGINPNIKVVRNDGIDIEEIRALAPSHIILSPGPGKPEDAGICKELISTFYTEIPILGVCLGHQAICETFGMKVTYAKKLMHGMADKIQIQEKGIFQGLNPSITVARYHSLIALKETLVEELEITGITDQDEVMAVSHKKYPTFGVQFHPESILTEDGQKILENFLAINK